MLNRSTQWSSTLCLLVCVTFVDGQDPSTVARRNPQPQVRYELGPDSLPQDGVPAGRLEGPFLFHSKIIENTARRYWIHVPANYDADQPACVLVFQDGARAINPDGVIRAPQVLDNLIAKKQIPVTVGIFITPGQRGDQFPDSIGTGNPNNRDREYDVLDDKYARFIVEEMLPEVGKKYNLTQDPAGRAIGGSSSGGICAFTVAWHMPHEFRNVISFIGSFTNIHGGHVYPQLVRETAKKDIRIFLQDGVNDLRSPNNLERDWHIQNQKMVAALKEKGYDAAHVFGEGGHSDDHGGAMLPEMLRWIWRDYPGIAKPEIDLVAKAASIKPAPVDLFPGFDSHATADPSGTWAWERRGRGRTQSMLRIAKSDDGTWTGSFESVRGEQQPESQDIKDISLEGNKLTFSVQGQFGDRVFTTTYQGVVHADKIVGWRMNEFNGTPRDRSWTATRKMSLTDFVGEWSVAIVGPNGNPISSKLNLQKNQEKIEGTYDSEFFGEAKAENVRWVEGSLQFDVTFSRNGNDFTLHYSAKPKDGQLLGTITSEFQGEKRETPFSAKRSK